MPHLTGGLAIAPHKRDLTLADNFQSRNRTRSLSQWHILAGRWRVHILSAGSPLPVSSRSRDSPDYGRQNYPW